MGSVIPDDYLVRKLRVASRDMQRGKSGGFRLLYKLTERAGEDVIVYLLFVYAKSLQADVSSSELENLVNDMSETPDDNDG